MPDLAADVAVRLRKQSKAMLPPGGQPGRVLKKGSGTDYDADWMPDDGVPAGGTDGQVLTKQSYVDGDADWEDPSGSGFPVGPLDDTDATYTIEGGGNGTFPQSIVASAIDDSTAVVGLIAVVGQNGDGGAIISGGTPDGGGAVLLVNAQEGNFAQIGLEVEADGAEPGQIQLTSTTGGDSAATVTATDITLVVTDDISLVATDNISLDPDSISIGTSPAMNLAFFGETGASQQATPSTLGDVIALLQAYGLCP